MQNSSFHELRFSMKGSRDNFTNHHFSKLFVFCALLTYFLSVNISDGFVPIGKDEYEKKHDANADLLEKAIDEVVAKQLDLGTIYKTHLQKICFFDTQDPYSWNMGDFQLDCENLLYLIDMSSLFKCIK